MSSFHSMESHTTSVTHAQVSNLHIIHSCLEKWKELKGDEATYSALIKAAKKARNQQLAGEVRLCHPDDWNQSLWLNEPSEKI